MKNKKVNFDGAAAGHKNRSLREEVVCHCADMGGGLQKKNMPGNPKGLPGILVKSEKLNKKY